MFEILSSSLDKVIDLLARLGYLGVFWLALLDRWTVFLIPAEIVLPAFGILISRGEFNFWPVLIWVTVGSFLGNLALYYIFLKGGRPFLQKYGKYILISRHDLGHLDRWFEKYGEKLVVWGYILPTSVRSLVPILAGISRMNVYRFSLYTFLISLPLNLLYIYIGIKAADNCKSILVYVEKFNYAVIAILAILIVWYVYRHRRGKHLTH